MNSKIMSTRNVAFMGIMGALGNVLSWVSISLAPFIPKIPFGLITISIALDFSHLTTFIGALYGGPALGGLTGLIGGLVAANEFGFSQGNLVTGFALPIGKALTGVAAGLIMRALGLSPNNHGILVIASKLQSVKERALLLKIYRILIVPSTILGYIPEGVFTVFVFLIMLPLYLQVPAEWFYLIVVQILIKAFIEMFAIGVVLVGLTMNRAFTDFVERYITVS